MSPLIGISLMPQDDFCEAIQPLFEENLVDVIEWSFDMGWGAKIPDWCREILSVYSECDRLLGHGISYSLLSAQRDNSRWLDCLKADCQEFRYRHITEHFGWMVAGEFIQGAPLPMPMTSATVAIGQNRLRQLSEVAQVPVGLENLAFAFHRQDVLTQGMFLTQLLEPIDGFILLDLHNLYCQMHNFQLSAEEILSTYPLEQVKELHLSGGSWSEIETHIIRRDTHDQEIPESVFTLLEMVLGLCPNIHTVIFERLGNTLVTQLEKQQFQSQFRQIHQIVEAHTSLNSGLIALDAIKPERCQIDQDIAIDEVARFQASSLSAFYETHNLTEATAILQHQGFNPKLEQYLSHAKPEMLQLAQHLIKKWGKRSSSI